MHVHTLVVILKIADFSCLSSSFRATTSVYHCAVVRGCVLSHLFFANYG
jgi:hypothetical protein